MHTWPRHTCYHWGECEGGGVTGGGGRAVVRGGGRGALIWEARVVAVCEVIKGNPLAVAVGGGCNAVRCWEGVVVLTVSRTLH
jgi:hypothetical protein